MLLGANVPAYSFALHIHIEQFAFRYWIFFFNLLSLGIATYTVRKSVVIAYLQSDLQIYN